VQWRALGLLVFISVGLFEGDRLPESPKTYLGAQLSWRKIRNERQIKTNPYPRGKEECSLRRGVSNFFFCEGFEVVAPDMSQEQKINQRR
jgi:hypothetical protein